MEESGVKIHRKPHMFIGADWRLRVDENYFHKLNIKLTPIKCPECISNGGKTQRLKI